MGRKEEVVEVVEGIPEVIYHPDPDHLVCLDRDPDHTDPDLDPFLPSNHLTFTDYIPR